jgi:ATP-dependent Zn protease
MNLPAVRLPEPDTIGEGSGPERPTRTRMALWDRTKFLLLFAVLFAFFVWGDLSDNPLIDLRDAIATTLEAKQWLLWLAGLEVLRQAHFLLSEHSPGYHQFWTEKVFARFEKRTSKLNPWNRYRLARVVKLLVFLAIVSVVLGALFDVPPVTALFELPARIFDVLPFAFQMMFGAFYVVMQFVLLFWFLTRGGTDVYFPDDIKTRFSDVWGQDPVVDRVKENLVFLERPEVIEEKGGYVPSGILLWGPPGTGKTLLAEAVAGETGKPYVFVDPGAFTNMFIGVGILKVKSLFRKLRKLALRYGGVIVFFDEADVLGNRGTGVAGQFRPADPGNPFHASCNGLNYASAATRQQLFVDTLGVGDDDRVVPRRIIMGGMGGGGGMGTLQALLTELSGLKKPRGFVNRIVRRTLGMKPKPPPKYRILVIMATNMPDALDPALLRPGRIDRIYHVGYPSTSGRERTYRGYLDKVTHALTDEQVHKLAVISTRGTGASIKDIVNEALVIAIGDGRDTITYNDMIRAKHLKTHGPADDWTYSDWEQHAVAVHEACHAVAMYRLKKREAIDVATIERRGGTGGFVAPAPMEDQFVSWRSELDSEVMTFLASLAGERLLFEGDNSQGVGGDLANSTRIVMRMMAMHGMGDTVASVGATLGLVRGVNSTVEDGTDRQFLETDLGRRVEAKLEELLEQVRVLLERDRQHVLAVAHALETHKTISGDDIVAIFDGEIGPLVDGRPYHDEDLRDELELYHTSVVAAMRSQGRVELPLPVLNGHLEPVELVPAVEPATATEDPPPNGGVAYPAHPPVLPGEGSSDPPR